MDYDEVNNPFITLRKLSGNEDETFTAKLNVAPPNVDNDQYRSNLKKSDHSLYSDERSTKLRMDEQTTTFENYAITLLDIDNILYEYFVNVIQPQVLDTAGSVINVPVRHASPEKWYAIQSDGVYRDQKGQVQRPMIIFTRTSVGKDDEFVHFNKYLSVPFLKKFDKKNMYDRFSLLNDVQPVYEVHNITFPDHVILSYDFTMSTEYVEQMNSLVEKINFANDDYWGDPKRLKFRTSIDSFSNAVEAPQDDDRNVTTTFTATVHAYLLPEVFNNKTTTQRGLTKRKVLWGTEAVASDDPRLSGGKFGEFINAKKPTEGTKMIFLDRTSQDLYLEKEEVTYEIRLRTDEEFYTIETDDNSYQIATDTDDIDNPVFVWDYERDEVIMKPGDVHNVQVGQKTIEIKVHDKTVEVITAKFV